MRYSKKNEVIFDPFVGSGTTAFEAETLERNFIGVDIQKNLAEQLRTKVGNKKYFSEIVLGDSSKNETFDEIREVLKKHKKKSVGLAILHPPYADIIKFSDLKGDLSNAKTLKEFLGGFGVILKNTIHCQFPVDMYLMTLGMVGV